MLSLPHNTTQTHTLTNHTLFPFANSHNEQSQMSTVVSPPSILPGKPTSHTLHTIFMPCLRMRIHGLVIWKNLANHWLSLVLMKGNNSLTCTKTVQKQPFLMSDTSRPRDAFYVSNSLIKQHPGERDRGHMKCVRLCVYVCITFGVWIVRCDLGTLIFTQQGSITLVVVLFIVFLLWQSTHFLSEQRGGLLFFFFLLLLILSNTEY